MRCASTIFHCKNNYQNITKLILMLLSFITRFPSHRTHQCHLSQFHHIAITTLLLRICIIVLIIFFICVDFERAILDKPSMEALGNRSWSNKFNPSELGVSGGVQDQQAHLVIQTFGSQEGCDHHSIILALGREEQMVMVNDYVVSIILYFQCT